MPVLGQTPTEAHLNQTTPAAPAGAVNVAFQAGAPYPDPNNPILEVRDISANVAKFAGDSGSGGTIGAVPAPAAGDASAGKFLKADGTWEIPPGGGSGGGSVNSVGLTMPPEFAVSGSPVTSSGTLAVTKATEPANQVWAGPSSGAAAAPAFRALVAVDIPPIPESGVINLVSDLAAKAPLASPALTGTPTAPTPTTPDNSTKIATTAFVDAAIAAAGGGGGGGTTPAALRGTAIASSSASTYTIPFPSGTIAGDLAILFGGHGWNINQPAGWVQMDNLAGTGWNGAVYYRTLSAGDITTGSVTVTAGGSFDGVFALAVVKGTTTNGVRTSAFISSRNGAGSPTISLSTDSSPLTTDLALYFGSNRAASTDTCNQGTLQQQANDLGSASGCLYAGAPSAAGTISATFSYSVAGSGNYQAIVVIEGVTSGGGSGTVTSVGLAAPAEFTVSGSPVTAAGTLTLTKANEAANTVWAGPSSGAAAAPAFRALASADLPSSPVFSGNPQAPVMWIPYVMAANLVAPTDGRAHIPGELSIPSTPGPSGLLVDLSASTGHTLLEVI